MKTSYLKFENYQLFIKQIFSNKSNTQQPTLIFLHDSWGCVEMWGDFPEKLVELSGLDALIYDRRGYGKSSPFAISQRDEFYLHHEANHLIEVLDSFKIENAIIYGHSDGATIALIAAALYPHRFEGLILEGAHSFIEDSGKAAVRATRERAKETNLIASLEKFHGKKSGELFRLWHETWLSDYFSKWSIVPILNKITCPVLAFQGKNDEFGSIEQLNILKRTISSEVIIAEIPNAGHTPRKEAIEQTTEFIRNWFITQKKRL
ncbi:MAG: alpha/beta fold hydrolase [Paludibacter sp.]